MDEKSVSSYFLRVLELQEQKQSEILAIEDKYEKLLHELAVEAEKDGVLNEVRNRLWSR